ncbi:MAG: ATP-binding protein [Verrucomicrobiota bacterium]
MSGEPTDNDAEAEIARLEKRHARERAARQEAEAIAERSTRELYDQQRRLVLLQGMVVAANEATHIEDAMATAVRRICAFSGWPVGHLCLCAENGDVIPTAVWHFNDAARFEEFRRVTEQMVFPRGVGLPGRVASSGKPAWITDLGHDRNFPRAKLVKNLNLKSGIGFPLLVGNDVVGVLEFFTDVQQEPDEDLLEVMAHVGTQLGRVIERQRSNEALERSEKYFRRLTENALDLITVLNADGTIRYQSPSIQIVMGYSPEHYVCRQVADYIHPDDVGAFTQALNLARQRAGSTRLLTFRFRHRDGSWRTLEGIGNNLLADPVVAGIVFNCRDISERKRLEEQFLQSQKMHAIGQLAGGVAHDFNNILTAVTVCSDMMLQQLEPSDALHMHAEEIRKAANRATALTRQLLAFSRKQVLQPRVLDLNTIVADMERMLRRLLGENVRFVTVLPPDLGRVKADPGQIEQVILNLVVNARDAVLPPVRDPQLVIETANVTFDRTHVGLGDEVPPGDYVMLAISDNGAGIPQDIRAHMFEPFFTTKERGRGTGLGLATCHGIVKQSGGRISVYTEEGRGTKFKVYLPRVTDAAEVLRPPHQPAVLPRGSETVLLVEDEPSLRNLGMDVLRELGYRVIPAANGTHALDIVEHDTAQQIQLVVTDVVMPEMGGLELVEELRKQAPQAKILYTSGYTEETIVLGAGIAFMQKPYTVATLANKVREVLDG